MKKRTAFLFLIFVLALSGCRVQPGGAGAPPAPDDSPAPAPTETASAPAVSASTEPVETELTDEPVPTGTLDAEPVPTDRPGEPEEPALPDEAGGYAAALAWCEDHRDEFSNAELYAMDRAYWFADYAPGVTTAVYDQGNAWFYEDPTGEQTVEEAAAALSALAAEAGEAALVPAPPMDWPALAAQLAETAAAAEDEGEMLRMLEAQRTRLPGLGEDMWLCGYPADSDVDGGWYVMMRQGNVYRLQHDHDFAAYAQSPEAQVRIQFDRALEAWNWFAASLIPVDAEDRVDTGEGELYYRVDVPGVTTLLELRAYLKTLFSDEIVDALLSTERYRDFDGVLYAAPLDSGYPLVIQGHGQVLRMSDTKLIYRVAGEILPTDPGDPSPEPQATTMDFPYELVGDKWVFTEFSWPG